jgi:hypothetical protein
MVLTYNFAGIIAGLRQSIISAGGTPQVQYEYNFKGIIQAIQDLEVTITELVANGGGGSGTVQPLIDDLVLDIGNVTGSLTLTEEKVNQILVALRGYPVIESPSTGQELIPIFVVPSAM